MTEGTLIRILFLQNISSNNKHFVIRRYFMVDTVKEYHLRWRLHCSMLQLFCNNKTCGIVDAVYNVPRVGVSTNAGHNHFFSLLLVRHLVQHFYFSAAVNKKDKASFCLMSYNVTRGKIKGRNIDMQHSTGPPPTQQKSLFLYQTLR